MTAVPLPGLPDPVHDGQQAFRAALDAFARPGRIQALPREVPGWPLGPAQAMLLLTLTDETTTVWWQDATPAVQRWLRFHTGARSVAAPGQATFAVATHPAEMPELRAFDAGSDISPEKSCTVLVEVPSLRQGPALPAHGPGIPDEVELAVAGLPEGFWAEWIATHGRFPQGVDMLFTCGRELLGLPRTTRIGPRRGA